MMMISRRSLVALVAGANLAGAATIHFDPYYTGAVQDGSSAHPWTSLDKCFATAVAGDVCLLEPGDYNLATATGGSIGRVGASGTPTAPIRLEARMEGSVFIGAWHDMSWTPVTGKTDTWVGTVAASLPSSIPNLQVATSGILNQSGVRLLYLSRRAFMQQATWPRSGSVFPRTTEISSGSTPQKYIANSLPDGDLTGAKVHIFRSEEQGAVVRTVSGRPSSNTLLISDGASDDALDALGGTRRFWLTGHPAVLDPAVDNGRWIWEESTQKVWMVSGLNPADLSLKLQISAIGPDFSSRSYWTVKGVVFYGVVPVTDAATTGLRFESVTFVGPGLNQGPASYKGRDAELTGVVLRGSGHVVDRSSFSVCPHSCVEILGPGMTVSNSVFAFTQLNGGAYAGAINIKGANATVRDNRLDEMGVSGIVLNDGSAGSRVSNNLIDGWGRLAYSRAGGITALYKGLGSVEIDSNMIFRQGIIDAPTSNPLPGGAINLQFGRDQAFVHHNIIDDAVVGIRLGGWVGQGETGDNSWNNSVLSNDVGAGVGCSWLRMSMASSNSYSGTRILDNIFRTDACYQGGNATRASDLVVDPADHPIAGGAIASNLLKGQDPYFTSPGATDWDYRLLLASSPAIDAGVAYTLPGGVALGYLGAAPDIGAVEYGTSWTAGVKPLKPVPTSSVFGMDDPAKWIIPVDQTVVASTDNKVEGTASFSVTPSGYKILESSAVDQSAVGGTNFVSFAVFVPSLQSNPYWVGAVQVYVECPSRGLWNQWVGQVELTNLAKDTWQIGRLPLPVFVTQQLQGATYSDLKVRIAVNLNPGSGNLGLDDFRFED